MKKNNFITASLSSLFLILFFMLIGCNEKSDLINNPLQNKSATADYYVVEFEDVMNSIEGATLDKNMGLTPIFAGDKDKSSFDGKRKNIKKPKRRGIFLRVVFRKLDLTESQKESIKTYIGEYHECLSAPLAQFREAAKEIMEGKREQIIAIRDKVKADELSREEARELIMEINIATREEIVNCVACIEAKEAMLVCKSNLFESIASILDEDQLIIWNEWLSRFQKT